MIHIELEQIQQVLDYFEISPKALAFNIFTDIQEERKGEKAVRLISCARLADGRRMILRFLNERHFIVDVSKLRLSTQTLEKQAIFSELLREKGMNVPKKYQKYGHFCMPLVIDGIPLDGMVEDYIGEPLQAFTTGLFYDYGRLLGQMHDISMKYQAHIDFSIVFQEVAENRTDYKMLLKDTDMGKLPKETMQAIIGLHDQKKDEIVRLWPELPRSAVQGDIYSCNNVSWTENGIGFYDFNIAADEVLLGDLLHLWFRTVYDISNEEEVSGWDLEWCWKQYMKGYREYRKLTEKERRAFPAVYSLLGSIYMTRYVAELLRQERYEDAVRQFEEVKKLLESDGGNLWMGEIE